MLSDCLEDWELNAELIVALESFVCHLYRYKNFRYQQSLKRIVWQKASVGKKKSWIYHCCHLDSSHYICTSCSQIMLQGFGYVIYSMWSKCPSIMEKVWLKAVKLFVLMMPFHKILWKSCLIKILTKEAWNSNKIPKMTLMLKVC